MTKVLNEAKLRTKTYETAITEKKELKIKLEVLIIILIKKEHLEYKIDYL